MRRLLRWPLAVLIALALHGVLLVSLSAPDTDTGARAAGQEGLVIDVAPAGAAPGTDEAVAEPEPERESPAQPESRPEPEPEPDPRIAAEQSRPEPQPEPRQTAERQGSAGDAGVGEGDASATTDGRAGGGEPGARADYLQRLRAHLERHKEYPRRARMRRIEGTVRMTFTVHADGRISGARIAESSGAPALDEAAERMLARADPAPAFPGDIGADRLELTVPVRYTLR